MAAYSPPATPTLDIDICGDLLKCLDEQIMTTQHRHEEAQKRLQKERRWATLHQPGQYDNAEEPRNTPPMMHPVQQLQDYLFNSTGIVLPQPPKWNKLTTCMRILRNLNDLALESLWSYGPCY